MEKILFVLKVPPPFHGSTGVNQRILDSEFLKTNFECIYFSLSISKTVSDVGRFSFRKIFSTMVSCIDLFKLVKRERPKLVYFAFSPFGLALLKDYLYFLIIRLFKIGMVFHLQVTGIQSYAKKKCFAHYLYKKIFNQNYLICLAPELISDIEPYLVNKPYVIPNGLVDIKFYQEENIRKKPGVKFRIIFISNFFKSKGVLDLVEALEVLKSRAIEFSVWIVGRSGDISTEELKERIHNSNICGSTEHIGVIVSDEEKYQQLKKSDVLVLPTSYDCLPTVILEAMQCGVPVISTYEGGIPSLIDHDKTGFLIEKQNIDGIADQIEYLIHNPEIKEKMGQAAKRKFETYFTWDKFQENLVETINSILLKLDKSL